MVLAEKIRMGVYWLKINGFDRKIRMGDISKSHNSLKPLQYFAILPVNEHSTM